MEVYLTSDLHFGHKNIIKYENRNYNTVEEMDEDFIKKWNNKVNNNDLVYILGDFSWYFCIMIKYHDLYISLHDRG